MVIKGGRRMTWNGQLGIACTAWAGVMMVGCGDFSVSNGEMGNMLYALHTDYEISGDALDEVSLLVGHTQQIQTIPVDSNDYGDEDGFSHVVTPESGVTVVQGSEQGDPWDFYVTVENPGSYTFETWRQGSLYDYIEMVFDAPSSLELIGWARAPWEEDFEAIEAGDALIEGTQVAFLPVPIDASGNRIAGDLFADLSVSDESMVVPGSNVYGVFEQGVYTTSSPSTVYFIDAGEAEVTLTDTPNQVSATWSFNVAEIGE